MRQAGVARWSGSKGERRRRREIQGRRGSRGSGEGPKGLGEIVKGVEDPRGEGRGGGGGGRRARAFNRSKDSERQGPRSTRAQTQEGKKILGGKRAGQGFREGILCYSIKRPIKAGRNVGSAFFCKIYKVNGR